MYLVPMTTIAPTTAQTLHETGAGKNCQCQFDHITTIVSSDPVPCTSVCVSVCVPRFRIFDFLPTTDLGLVPTFQSSSVKHCNCRAILNLAFVRLHSFVEECGI